MNEIDVKKYYELAQQYFYESFKQYQEGEDILDIEKLPSNVKIDDIVLSPHNVSIVYDYPMFDTPFISIRVDLSVENNTFSGMYKLYVDMEGKYLDDWFKYEIGDSELPPLDDST